MNQIYIIPYYVHYTHICITYTCIIKKEITLPNCIFLENKLPIFNNKSLKTINIGYLRIETDF